jgi:hypothetical protein
MDGQTDSQISGLDNLRFLQVNSFVGLGHPTSGISVETEAT